MAKYYLEHYGFVGEDEPYLAHHGILGQRWGKRNGPPYPLSEGKHNKVIGKEQKQDRPLSEKKRDKIYHDLSRNWNNPKIVDKYRKYLKYTEEDKKTIEEAKKYDFKVDERSYLMSLMLSSGKGDLRFDKDLDFDGTKHEIGVESDYKTKKFDFPSINSSVEKYTKNYKTIRNNCIKTAKNAGIYEDLLNNVENPGHIVWDDWSSIDDGKGDIINLSCWSSGDHCQNFYYYVKNGKIEIGPMDG